MKLIQQAGAAALQRRTGETGVKFTTFIPVRFKKRGACTVIVPAQADAAAQASPFVSLGKIPPSCDTALLIALGRAFHWQRLLDEGIAASGSDRAAGGATSVDRQRAAAPESACAGHCRGADRGTAAENDDPTLVSKKSVARQLGAAMRDRGGVRAIGFQFSSKILQPQYPTSGLLVGMRRFQCRDNRLNRI